MKAKIIKRIHPKPQPGVVFVKLDMPLVVPCIGNFDPDTLNKKIQLPRKYFIAFTDYKKKDSRTKYYKIKIKSI